MKRIKNFILALIMVLAMTFTACDWSKPGTSGNVDSVAVDSIELVTDTVAAPQDTVTMIQCYAITKAGKQCERLVFPPDTLCFQHKKMLHQ